MTREQLKALEETALAELARIRAKMKWLDRRDLRNKVIFIALGCAVMAWAILAGPSAV